MTAFPDWQNRTDELIISGTEVVSSMTRSGTHRGKLLDVEPTGKGVVYVGASIFHLRDGRIEDGLVLGHTQELRNALDKL